jgi:hypothetical protein
MEICTVLVMVAHSIHKQERYVCCVGKTGLKTDIGGAVRGDSVASDLLGNINPKLTARLSGFLLLQR